MLRPLTAFHCDLYKIFSQGPVKDHELQGPLRSLRGCQGPDKNLTKSSAAGEIPRRSWHKKPAITRDSLPQELSYKHLYNTWHLQDLYARTSCRGLYRIRQGPLREDFVSISTTSSHKDACNIMQGPLRGMPAGSSQDLHIRTCTRSRDWPVQDHASTSDRISSGSSEHLLTRTCTRPWSRFSYVTDL